MNWKRIAKWFVATVGILTLLVVAAVIIVHTSAFHRFVLNKIVQQAEQATGGRVEVGSYTIHWSGLRVDFYNIAIHGNEPASGAPLARAGHLQVDLKIVSLLQHKIDLSQLILDDPAVNLIVDKRGNSNVPKPGTPGGGSINVFDFGIRYAALHRGLIVYNNRQSPLEAELRDVEAQVKYDAAKDSYDGFLGYRQGRIVYEGYNPLDHNLQMRFAAARSGLNINSLNLVSGPSRITLRASLTNYNSPVIRGDYQAILSTVQLRRISKNSSLPAGDLRLSGSLRYSRVPKESFLAGLMMTGHVSSPALVLRVSSGGMAARALSGDFRLEHDNLIVEGLRAEMLGGQLEARAQLRNLTGQTEGSLNASLHSASLADVSAMSGSKQAQRMPLSGRVEASTEANWRGSLQNLNAKADATISGSLTSIPAPGAVAQSYRIPLNGAVHALYQGAHSSLSLRNSYLRTPHTLAGLDGTLSSHSSLAVQLKTTDLHELDLLAYTLQRATAKRGAAPPHMMGISGSANFAGRVLGPEKSPQLTGQLAASNLEVQGSRWRSLRTGIVLGDSKIALQNGELEAIPQGRIAFDVSAGLRHWSFTPSSPIAVRATASRLSVADLQHLAKVNYPVSGTLSARITASGSELNPAGKGQIELTQARIENEPLQNLSIKFRGTGNAIYTTLEAKLPAGAVSGNFDYLPKTEGYALHLRVPGLNLAMLRTLSDRHFSVAGTLTASAQGQGTVKQPQLIATVQVAKLQIQGKAAGTLRADLAAANQQAKVVLAAALPSTALQAKADINLRGDYFTIASLDSRNIALGPVLAMYLPGTAGGIQGDTEVHAWMRGPLKNRSQLQAHVEMPRLVVSYRDMQIAAMKPVIFDYQSGNLTIVSAELVGSGTDVRAQGNIPLIGNAPLNLNLLGTVDLHLLRILGPDVTSAGKINLNLRAQGSRGQPGIHGDIHLVDLSYTSATAPIGVEKVNGDIAVANDRAEIRQLTGEVGGGTISASGGVTYRPRLALDLALAGKDIRIRYPQGVRTVASTNLTLTGNMQSSLLSGNVLINELSFTKEFDLANFAAQFSGQSAPSASTGFEQNLKLDVVLHSTSQLQLASSTLSLQGSANLRVSGTAGNPIILGRVGLTGGELFFMGKRYEVTNGTIDFANPLRTDPVVNLSVTTTVQQYNLTLTFLGPIDRLRTTYVSDPALPPVDIINLLAFGQTTEQAATTPSQPASLGAESILAQGLSSQVSSRIAKFAGISQLTIDPGIGGNQQDPGTRIAIQQRVTKNLLFTFASDVTNTQNEIIQGQYEFSKHWAASVSRDENGTISVNGTFTKIF